MASEVPFPVSDPRGSSLEWLTEVCRQAATGVGVAEVVDTLWAGGRRPLDIDLLAVARVDPSGTVRWSRWWVAGDRRQPDVEPVVSAAVIDRIAERTAPWVIDLASDGDRRTSNGLHLPTAGGEYRSCVLVPMRAAGAPVGLAVVARFGPDGWSDDQLRLLEVCCNRLAAMIERDRLDESLRAAAARLEATGRDLERLTRLDPVTGLPTRSALEAQLELEWRRAWRTRRPLSMLVAEIDDLDGYRERFGSDLADRCVNQVASELTRGLRRAGDFTARTDARTFAVLLPGAVADDAARAAERVRAGIEGLRIPHQAASPVRPWLSVSIGIASVIPSSGSSPRSLMECADLARRDAVDEGRNRVRWREPAGDDVDPAGASLAGRRRSPGGR